MNGQCILIRHGIGDSKILVARKAKIAFLHFQREGDKVLPRQGMPHSLVCSMIIIRMQVVRSIIDRELHSLSVQDKLRTAGTVCNRSDQRPEVIAVVKIALGTVKAKDHVLHGSMRIRYKKIHQICSEVRHSRADHSVVNGIEINLFPLPGTSEKLFFYTHSLPLSIAPCVPPVHAEASLHQYIPDHRQPERRWQSA
ncbi:unknown [Firmicutes bacterium CAG:791]|nr:unknown [Firmicutes bacterium CAG:791]